ncbi:unnamed protein product [Durusdinium trenchii]|uniref:Radial spoke head protein 9 homolog n=2 Tax=Durusdinium trenchii TaxID=1381693 RepID=A0ABP0I725_9DINO
MRGLGDRQAEPVSKTPVAVFSADRRSPRWVQAGHLVWPLSALTSPSPSSEPGLEVPGHGVWRLEKIEAPVGVVQELFSGSEGAIRIQSRCGFYAEVRPSEEASCCGRCTALPAAPGVGPGVVVSKSLVNFQPPRAGFWPRHFVRAHDEAMEVIHSLASLRGSVLSRSAERWRRLEGEKAVVLELADDTAKRVGLWLFCGRYFTRVLGHEGVVSSCCCASLGRLKRMRGHVVEDDLRRYEALEGEVEAKGELRITRDVWRQSEGVVLFSSERSSAQLKRSGGQASLLLCLPSGVEEWKVHRWEFDPFDVEEEVQAPRSVRPEPPRKVAKVAKVAFKAPSKEEQAAQAAKASKFASAVAAAAKAVAAATERPPSSEAPQLPQLPVFSSEGEPAELAGRTRAAAASAGTAATASAEAAQEPAAQVPAQTEAPLSATQAEQLEQLRQILSGQVSASTGSAEKPLPPWKRPTATQNAPSDGDAKTERHMRDATSLRCDVHEEMEYTDLEPGLQSVASGGHVLNCQEISALKAGLALMKAQDKFQQVCFWGKIFGLTADYYVAYGLAAGNFEFPTKHFFFAGKDFQFAPLTAPTPEEAVRLLELSGEKPLTGIGSTSLEVAKEEEPVEDPPEGESGTLEADSGGCHGRPMRAWWMNAVPGVRGIGVMRDLFSSQCACALDLNVRPPNDVVRRKCTNCVTPMVFSAFLLPHSYLLQKPEPEDLKAAIERELPEAQPGEGDVCSVCLEGFDVASAKQLKCKHCYHSDCLTSWARSEQRRRQTPHGLVRIVCPLCQPSPLVISPLSQSFLSSAASERGAAIALKRVRPVPAGPKKLTEADRLAQLVLEIDFETSCVPRGAYCIDEQHSIVSSNDFKGLGVADAAALTSYVHFRAPVSIAALRSLARKDAQVYSGQILDGLDSDQPKGCWALRKDPTANLVTLRSLSWPGYIAYHVPETRKFGGLYFGYAQKDLSLPFVL